MHPHFNGQERPVDKLWVLFKESSDHLEVRGGQVVAVELA